MSHIMYRNWNVRSKYGGSNYLCFLPLAHAPSGRTHTRPTSWPFAKLPFVHSLVTKSGRNLQLRLRNGDLPLEGGLRLAFCVRLHVRLTRVAVVQGPICTLRPILVLHMHLVSGMIFTNKSSTHTLNVNHIVIRIVIADNFISHLPSQVDPPRTQ